jgi:hypothetical protein
MNEFKNVMSHGKKQVAKINTNYFILCHSILSIGKVQNFSYEEAIHPFCTVVPLVREEENEAWG